MTAGNIPTSSIPGWPNPPQGLMPACQTSLNNAGINGALFIGPQGLHTPDLANTNAVLSTYTGSATELTFTKDTRKKALYDLVDNYYDLRALADGNTTTNLSANTVGTYLANVGNNYRTKKAAINNAATVAAVNAVDINTGWPAYP
jgi:hypothetical protein